MYPLRTMRISLSVQTACTLSKDQVSASGVQLPYLYTLLLLPGDVSIRGDFD
jgi:hypothetical protein